MEPFVNRITNSKKKNNNNSSLSPKNPVLSNNTINNKKNISKVEPSQSLKKFPILIPPIILCFYSIFMQITVKGEKNKFIGKKYIKWTH